MISSKFVSHHYPATQANRSTNEFRKDFSHGLYSLAQLLLENKLLRNTREMQDSWLENIMSEISDLLGTMKRSEQSRAEQSRAEQSRAEQSRAEQSRAEQSRAEQSRAEQSRAEQSRAEWSRKEETKFGRHCRSGLVHLSTNKGKDRRRQGLGLQ